MHHICMCSWLSDNLVKSKKNKRGFASDRHAQLKTVLPRSYVEGMKTAKDFPQGQDKTTNNNTNNIEETVRNDVGCTIVCSRSHGCPFQLVAVPQDACCIIVKKSFCSFCHLQPLVANRTMCFDQLCLPRYCTVHQLGPVSVPRLIVKNWMRSCADARNYVTVTIICPSLLICLMMQITSFLSGF